MEFFSNAIALKGQWPKEIFATLYMVFFTALIAGVLGLILGIILVVTEEDGIMENKFIYGLLDKLINLFRSIPFIILLANLAPLTRAIVGTNIGNTAALVPLVFGTVPFFARQVHSALVTVDRGIVETAQSMGDNNIDIINQVYLREGLPNIIRASSITLISLVGLTTFAGALGADGLGKIAISIGYNRFQQDVTIVATLFILVLVYAIQGISNILINKLKH